MVDKKVRDKINHWLEHTTVHGIPNIKTSEKKSAKIIWLICLLISGGYCGYVLSDNIMKYLKFDVETVIEITRDTNSLFPTVTFCNLQLCGNDYNLEINDEFLVREINKTIPGTTRENLNKLPISEIIKILRKEVLQKHNRTNHNNVKSIKNNTISCLFSSDFCNEFSFEYFELNEFQSCFKFNGIIDEEKKSRRYGKVYGLQLELFIGIPKTCINPLSDTFGMIAYLHNSSYNITEDSYGVQLSPGTETNIAVERTFIKRKSKPFSNCIENIQSEENSKLVKETFKISKKYSQKTCIDLCFQQYLIKQHNCFTEYLPYNREVLEKPQCDRIIFKEARDEYYNKSEDKRCFEMCPQECEYINFDLTVSNSRFPTSTYAEVLMYNENITNNFDASKGSSEYPKVLSSVLSVNVFYKSDLMTIIRQKELISVEVFISNIGGTMGLFLGLSLLSVVEFFEFLLEIVLIYIEKYFDYKKSKVENMTENKDN